MVCLWLFCWKVSFQSLYNVLFSPFFSLEIHVFVLGYQQLHNDMQWFSMDLSCLGFAGFFNLQLIGGFLLLHIWEISSYYLFKVCIYLPLLCLEIVPLSGSSVHLFLYTSLFLLGFGAMFSRIPGDFKSTSRHYILKIVEW